MGRRLLICGALLLSGCGPLAIGAGIASAFSSSGSGDVTEPDVSIRSEIGEDPPEFVGRPVPGDPSQRPELVLFLDVNKPTVIELELFVLRRAPDGTVEVLFGSEDALADPDPERIVKDCRNAIPDPATSDDPCAVFFQPPRDDIGPPAPGFALTLDGEFVTLAELPDGQYTLLVRAFDPSQQTAKYDDHDFIVDTDPPGAPTVVSIDVPAPRQLRVNWLEASDLGTGVEHYILHYHVGGATIPDMRSDTDTGTLYEGRPFETQGGRLDSPIEDLPNSDFTYTLNGLFSGRTHYVQVQAVDFAGNRSPLSKAGEATVTTRVGADGRFEAAVAFEAGDSPTGVGTGDFNGDGILDVAVVHDGTSGVSVLVGNRRTDVVRRGDGTLSDPVTFAWTTASGAEPTLVGLGVEDVTGDGLSDLVLIGVVGAERTHVAVVSPSLDATGDVELSLTQEFEVLGLQLEPRDLLLEDLSGDGIADVLIVGRVLAGDSENVARLYLGTADADRPFGPSRRISFLDLATGPDTPGANAVAAGTFDDLDMLPDLVFGVANSLNADHGLGDGFFGGTTTTATSAEILDLTTGDFDSDGLLDVIATHPDGTFDFIAGLGRDPTDFSTRFKLPVTIRIADDGASRVVVGDFSGDGIDDLAFALAAGHAGDTQPVKLRLGGGSAGRGDGNFPGNRTFGIRTTGDLPEADTMPSSIASGDFNGDGILDLVVTTPGTGHVRILIGRGARGRGNGTFVPGTTIERGRELLLLEAAADLDGDGIVDLAGIQEEVQESRLFVEKARGLGADGVGDAAFQFTGRSGVAFFAFGHKRLIATEVTGGGPLDFVTTNGSLLIVHHTTPEGTFTGLPGGEPFVRLGGASYGPGQQQPPVRADFDKDGDLDLVVTTVAGAALFEGAGPGLLTPRADPILAGSRFPDAVVAGEFTGDGNPDLCFLDRAAGKVLLAAGTGMTAPFAGRAMADLPRSELHLLGTKATADFHTIAAADFDLDGRDDLCVVTREGDVRVLLNTNGARVRDAFGIARSGDDWIVSDLEGGQLFRIEVPSGHATLLTHGAPLTTPGAVAVDQNTNTAYVIDGASILAIDLETGEATSIAVELGIPARLALDNDGSHLIVAGRFLDDDSDEYDGVIEIDVATAASKIVSATGAESIGEGFAFTAPAGVAVLANGDLLVSDSVQAVVFRIDRTTGDRMVLSGVETVVTGEPPMDSDEERGTGDALVAPGDIALDEADGRALVLDDGTITEVDLTTGDRSSLATDLTGARALAYDSDLDAVFVTLATGAVIRIDVADARRRLATPDGPFDLPSELESELETAAIKAIEEGGFEPLSDGERAFTAGLARVADINGDGVPDLVLLSLRRAAIAVLLAEVDSDGRTPGTFEAPVVTVLSSFGSARSMVVADLNNDGIPDAAVGVSVGATHQIRILLGGGVLEGR